MPSLKRRSNQKWDGDIKNKTKDCPSCNFNVNFQNKEICAWGVAFKYIVGDNPNRKCEYYGKEIPEKSSFEYVKYATHNNLLGRSKNYKNYARQLKINFEK